MRGEEVRGAAEESVVLGWMRWRCASFYFCLFKCCGARGVPNRKNERRGDKNTRARLLVRGVADAESASTRDGTSNRVAISISVRSVAVPQCITYKGNGPTE